MNKLLTTLTSMAAFSFLTTTSQATVFWDLVQDGNNVTATASGHFLQSMSNDGYSPANGSSTVFFGTGVLGVGSPGSNRTVVGEDVPQFQFSSTVPDDFSGHTFRTVGNNRLQWSGSFYGNTFDSADVIDAKMTFNDKTLADLGVLASDAGTVLWQMKDTTDVGNAIVLKVNGAAAVPEPSSTALLGLGTLCLLARRKR